MYSNSAEHRLEDTVADLGHGASSTRLAGCDFELPKEAVPSIQSSHSRQMRHFLSKLKEMIPM